MNNMKKIILSLIIVMFSFSATFATENPLASLTHFLGEVMFKRPTSKEWLPASKGMVFFPDDLIKTHKTGKAELFFYSGTQVKIAPDTEVKFEGEKEGLTKSLYVSYGQLSNKVKKGDGFALQTPHAAIFVRGTEFDIAVNDNGLDVWVAEGLVVVENSKGSIQSEKNTHTQTNKDAEPNKKKANKGDMPKWKNDFKAKAVLSVMSPGKKIENETFQINLTLKDPESSKLIKGISKLNLKSLNENMGFALEQDAKSWTQDLEVEVVKGMGKVFANGAAGEHEISVTGEDLTGVKLSLKVEAVVKERKVLLKVIDKDGIEQSIQIDYKTK